MQTSRLVQAVILMTIVAMAASCASTKEYTAKIFEARGVQEQADSNVLAIQFLDMEDSVLMNQDDWVSTDIITGKDTIDQTLALDKLSKTIPPATPQTVDSAKSTKPLESEPVARSTNNSDGTRSKRTRD